MKRFIERRAVVSAIQFTGENIPECVDAVHPGWQSGDLPPGWWTMTRPGEIRLVIDIDGKGREYIDLSPGDWLINSGHAALMSLPHAEFEERFIAARDIGVQP